MIIPRWLRYSTSWSFIHFLLDGFALTPRSIVRLASVSLCLAAGIMAGNLLGKHFGSVYGTAGRWVADIVSAIAVLILVWLILLGRILLFFPFPTCRKGKCHSIGDYVWYVGSIYGRVRWGVYHYRCRCGDEYIRKGRKFMEVLPDGTKRSYKQLVGFRKWADDFDFPERNVLPKQ